MKYSPRMSALRITLLRELNVLLNDDDDDATPLGGELNLRRSSVRECE